MVNYARGRRTIVLILITLFRNRKLQTQILLKNQWHMPEHMQIENICWYSVLHIICITHMEYLFTFFNRRYQLHCNFLLYLIYFVTVDSSLYLPGNTEIKGTIGNSFYCLEYFLFSLELQFISISLIAKIFNIMQVMLLSSTWVIM